MESGYSRNSTLDCIKLAASYFVVFIHVPFSGIAGTAIDAAGRFAVPLFFMVSGYFSYGNSRERIKNKIISLMYLICLSVVVHNFVNFAPYILKKDFPGLLALLKSYADIKKIIDFTVFNVPFSSTRQWFLFALLYCYVIKWIFCYADEKKVFRRSMAMILVHLATGEMMGMAGIHIPVHFLRNFFMMGLPFFVAGMFVRKNKKLFADFPDIKIAVVLIAGAAESIASALIFGKNELYIGSVLILTGLWAIIIKYPAIESGFIKRFPQCSTYVYIFHKLVEYTIGFMAKNVGIDVSSPSVIGVMPFAVCFVSTVAAVAFIKINMRCISVVKKRCRNL